MEYEKDNGVMGRVPEFGAIFMSNISTKKECFRRKLFGLPLAMANFAKQVKAGMILFLFEFERRELFGVFRATSDGVMNIVPNAFSSSGHFPAQVRFTPIWFCSPLSEHEFRDAIRENYFSAKKFNFGLSEDQVHRLLCLFSSRKLKNRLPQRQFAREVTIPFRKDRGQVDDDTIRDIVGFEPDKGNYSTRSIISKSPLNSSNRVKRVDYDRFSVGNMAESEDKVDYDLGQGIWTGNAGDSWGKRRRIYDDDDNDSFFMGNVTENDRFDDRAPGQALLSECNGDSLGKERRVADDGQFLTGDRIKIKREMDNVIEPVISTDYLENSFNKARRVGVDGRFQMMDRGRNECDIDAGSRQVVLTEHHDSPLHKVKLTTDDDGFLMNNSSVENKCRRPSDVGTFLVRDRAENEHNADNSFGSVISADYSRYSLGEDRLIANDGRFRKNDKDIDNFRRPVISTDYTAFSQSTQNPLVNSSKPFIETEYSSALTRLKEVPVFDRPYHTSHDAIVTSTVPYDPEVPDIYHRQPLPFGPGRSSENAPRSFQGSNGNYWSPSKSKSTPYHSELESLSRCLDVTPGYGNKVPLPEVLPDFQKINRVSTPIRISNASNRWDRSSYATSNTLSNAGYSESREFTNSACEGYSGTLFLDPSLDYIPLSNGETCEKENNPFSYALGSIKDSSFAFNNDYPVESHQDHERKILFPENNEAPTRKEFPSPDAGGFRFGYVAKPSEAQDLYLHEKGSVDENSHYQSSGSMHCDKKNNRTSVFARLTLAPKVRVQEQENDTQVVYDKYDMDASVDDVMDLLRQSRNHQIKMRKYKPLVRWHDNDENIRAKKFFAIHNQMKYEESMMTSAKNEGDPEMTIDLNRIIEKSGEPLLEETRLVDFKRRSEIKKNLDETTTKDTVGTGEARVYVYNAESEGLFGNKSADNAEGLVGKPRKRRKLVRPAFGKEDPIDESISGDSTLNLILPSHINSLSPKNGESCENNDTPPNVESVQVTCSTSCDGNNTNAEQSSECWEKGNSDNCGDGREAPNDIQNRLSDLLSMVKNRNVGGSSSNEDPVADLTSQDLGMDRCYSQAKESPIDVYDVPGNRAKCRGNEDLFQDAEKAKEICPEL